MTLRDLLKRNEFDVRVTLTGKKDGLLYYVGAYRYETNDFQTMFIDPLLYKKFDKEKTE